MDPRLLEEYHTLNIIIERDKVVTSFKYALLRGTIEICQKYSHFAKPDGDRVWYPLGLLIERWIVYYYPIFEYEWFVPQLNGEKALNVPSKKILFRRPLAAIIDYYRLKGGFSAFYNDYRRGDLPDELQSTMRDLIQKTKIAITDGPIQHLGFSQYGQYYRVFDWDRHNNPLPRTTISPEYLIKNCGMFSLSNDLTSLFRYFGSFIIGEGTLLNKWADFTINISKAQGLPVTKEQVLDLLGRSPDNERQVQEAQRFYHQRLADTGRLTCVWSGDVILSHRNLHIDHLLPFSLWKNNDFWNLMPACAPVNLKKKDAVPSPDLLDNRREVIFDYWILLAKGYPDTFSTEINAALIGSRDPLDDQWMHKAFTNLVQECTFLIEDRGYAAWNL